MSISNLATVNNVSIQRQFLYDKQVNSSEIAEFDYDELFQHHWENITKLYEQTFNYTEYVRNVAVIFAYSIIFFVSLFGNLMVCHIIATNTRLHNFTNCFIANLSVADLLLTFNTPFSVARILLENWPFGYFFCKCQPFIQATSVYVSTITICIISIDRYCVVVHPLGTRITDLVPLWLVLVVIWCVSIALAVPFSIFNQVTKIHLIVRQVVRCRAIHSHAESYNKTLTLLAFLTQYLLPLSIASVAYLSIALHIKHRSKLGSMTRKQICAILRTNRQTITMLVLVLIVFGICWLPLHFFYLYRDFINSNLYHTKLFIASHWLAMSSVCYNPFIYSARNKQFRVGMKNFFRCLLFKKPLIRQSSPTSGEVKHLLNLTQVTSSFNFGSQKCFARCSKRKQNAQTSNSRLASVDSSIKNDTANCQQTCKLAKPPFTHAKFITFQYEFKSNVQCLSRETLQLTRGPKSIPELPTGSVGSKCSIGRCPCDQHNFIDKSIKKRSTYAKMHAKNDEPILTEDQTTVLSHGFQRTNMRHRALVPKMQRKKFKAPFLDGYSRENNLGQVSACLKKSNTVDVLIVTHEVAQI